MHALHKITANGFMVVQMTRLRSRSLCVALFAKSIYNQFSRCNKILLHFSCHRQHEVLHFTQFVRANAQKIGCAASTSKTYMKGRDWNAIWLACNYSYGNMIGTSVYQAGPPASACQTGNNPQYPGLCSPNEQYDN